MRYSVRLALQKAVILLCISLLLFFFGGQVFAADIEPDLEEALAVLDPQYQMPVTIKLKKREDISALKGIKNKRLRREQIITKLKSRAANDQGPIIAFLKRHGAEKITVLWINNSMHVVAPVSALRELTDYHEIKSMHLEYARRLLLMSEGIQGDPEWNLKMINAPQVWNRGFTGRGVVVANMDTGVDLNHPDLREKWRGGTNSWYDPYDPYGKYALPYDSDGHGTSVMGVMVGGSESGTSIGVAPEAKWIAAKIFNNNGDAYDTDIHSSFQWLLDPDGDPSTDDAPDIINLSWGRQGCDEEFREDIQNLRTSGIAVVAAAGNGGPNNSTSVIPGSYPESFAVGAVNDLMNITKFSSRGPSACDGRIYPDVVAPGRNIKSADLTFGGISTNPYIYTSGTSIAAPHVAGAMALLLQAFPDLTVDGVENALKQSAVDREPIGPDNAYGYGVIDILRAFAILGADISISFPSLSFGTVGVRIPSPPQTIMVTNNSDRVDLLVTGISIKGLDKNDFAVRNDLCTGASISPYNSCTFDVVFSPYKTGTKVAQIEISSNDFDEPVMTIVLKGTGGFSNIEIINPANGEVIPSGTEYVIKWTPIPSAVRYALLFYNGMRWKVIDRDILDSSHIWKAPIPLGNKRNCLIKVIGYGTDGAKVGVGKSAAPFSIEVVKLIFPDGLPSPEVQTLNSGISYSITWSTNATLRPVAYVSIYYSGNGGITWKRIDNVEGNPGRYTWKVPSPKFQQKKNIVKIILRDKNGCPLGKDRSDNFFTISPPL